MWVILGIRLLSFPLSHNLLLPEYSFYLLTISPVCVATGFGTPDGFSFGPQKSGQRRGGEGWTVRLCVYVQLEKTR